MNREHLGMLLALGLLATTTGCEPPPTQAAATKPVIPLDTYSLVNVHPDVPRIYGWGLGELPPTENRAYRVLRAAKVKPGEQLLLPLRVERKWWENKQVYFEFSDDLAHAHPTGFPIKITDRIRYETFSLPAHLTSTDPLTVESEVLRLQGTLNRPEHYLKIKRISEAGKAPFYVVQFLEQVPLRKRIALDAPVQLTEEAEEQ